MAKINGYGKWRIVTAFVLAFALWSLSCAGADDDAAAKAEQLRAKGDHVAAVKVLAEAIKANPLDQRLSDMLRDSQRILSEEEARRKKEEASREAAALRIKANAFYEQGDLDAAIRVWSRVLVLDPQDDSSAWMIQKAQTRKQLEPAAPGSGEAPRDYSKKIKAIADDITKLIAQAKEKMRQEGEERKRQELAALEEDAANEKRLRLEEERRSQEREEAFIAGTFKQGQELYAKGKYDEALCAWEAVLPLLTQDSELRAKISVLCEMKKEPAPSVPSVPEPVTVSPETVAPITPPPVVAKNTVLPVPAGSSRGSARIVIAIAAIMVLAALIGTVFYAVRLFIFPRRQPPAGKGFDPSKLASFLKKAKQDERRDKDIFKVR